MFFCGVDTPGLGAAAAAEIREQAVMELTASAKIRIAEIRLSARVLCIQFHLSGGLRSVAIANFPPLGPPFLLLLGTMSKADARAGWRLEWGNRGHGERIARQGFPRAGQGDGSCCLRAFQSDHHKSCQLSVACERRPAPRESLAIAPLCLRFRSALDLLSFDSHSDISSGDRSSLRGLVG